MLLLPDFTIFYTALNKQTKKLTCRLTLFGSVFFTGTFVCPGITRTLNSSSTFKQISQFLYLTSKVHHTTDNVP